MWKDSEKQRLEVAVPVGVKETPWEGLFGNLSPGAVVVCTLCCNIPVTCETLPLQVMDGEMRRGKTAGWQCLGGHVRSSVSTSSCS